MFSDLLKWGGRRPSRTAEPGDLPPPKGGDQVVPTKGLPKFLTAVANQSDPVVIDLGPVIGSNVGFLGDRLGCKLFIEDLVTELDRNIKARNLDALAPALVARLQRDDASVDGVLCWDFFDFLPKVVAQAVAREIVRILRPGGIVMGFFSTVAVERAPFTKYEIVDDRTLRHRHHPGAGGPKYPLQNRDIIKMFDGLAVVESFLLKNNTREILLKKRLQAAPAD